MYETNYHRPASIEEAVELFSKSEDASFLAGGQTLLPTMKQRLAAPTDVIDLTHISQMHGIEVQNNVIKIGAATPHAEVADSASVISHLPALAQLASHIGDPQTRNMGTLGGSVANNDPAADYPAAVLALDATIHTNTRTIAADDFFTDLFETSLDDAEIITHITFKIPQLAAYAKFDNPASRYAMAGVFLATYEDGTVRAAVTGAGSNGAFRHTELEDALSASWTAAAVDAVKVDENDMLSDIHGTAAYRANLVKVMAKRAIEATI